MVFELFTSLKVIAKTGEVSIDNNAFKLHYKATAVLLAAASILVTSRQYFGEPIECINRDDIPEKVMNTFCWIHSTFTLPGSLTKTVGEEVVAPGVEKYVDGQPRVFHKYYQWVCFVLFIQAVFFYVPRYLWKMWEGGRLKSLVLHLRSPILDKESRDNDIVMLKDYMSSHLGNHNTYFYYFVFCEILNFINVIVQMLIMDSFLGGAFSTYGIDVLKYSEADPETRVDPMVRAFPRLTKCRFHRFGPSGEVTKHDALCILPTNIINEKIYIFIWFWFVALAFISGFIIVYRFAIIFFRPLRLKVLSSRARLADRYQIQHVLDRADAGDWFILYLLAKNIDSLNYRELIAQLSKDLVPEGERFTKPGLEETSFNKPEKSQ